MFDYKLKCDKCKVEQVVQIDETIPFFNQARKRDWAKLTCKNCGTSLFAAKFSKKSNLLFTMVNT